MVNKGNHPQMALIQVTLHSQTLTFMDDIINASELTQSPDVSQEAFVIKVRNTLAASARIFEEEKYKIATAISKSLKGMRKFIFLNEFVVGAATCPSFWKLAAEAIMAPRGFRETMTDMEEKMI